MYYQICLEGDSEAPFVVEPMVSVELDNTSLEEDIFQPLKHLNKIKKRGNPHSPKKSRLQYCNLGYISLGEGIPQPLVRLQEGG